MWSRKVSVLALLENFASLENPSLNGTVFEYSFMVHLRTLGGRKVSVLALLENFASLENPSLRNSI